MVGAKERYHIQTHDAGDEHCLISQGRLDRKTVQPEYWYWDVMSEFDQRRFEEMYAEPSERGEVVEERSRLAATLMETPTDGN